MKLIDIKEMPDYNPAVPNGSDSVSQGVVTLLGGSPWCKYHGAMNCVSTNRKIWRCLTCHAGCYREVS